MSGEGLERVRERLRDHALTWWRVMRLMYGRMSHSVSAMMAAAIGFYALVCLGPLGILLAWVLQPVLGKGGRTYAWLRYVVNRVAGETAGEIMGEIDALVTSPDVHTAGVVSVALLVWASLRLFEALERSLTEVWPGRRRRGFVTRKLMALGSMAVAGGLLVAAILINALLPTALAWLNRLPTVEATGGLTVSPVLRVVIESLVTFVAYLLLFWFIPAEAVPPRVAVVGALFTTILWKLVSPVFTLVISRSAEHSTVYGGLAGVVMFLTWAFFGGRVLLLGGYFAAAYEHVIYRGRPESSDEAFMRMRALETAEMPPQRAEGGSPLPRHGPPLV